VIVGASAWTFVVLVRAGLSSAGVNEARLGLASALQTALTFMLAGTLLKAISIGGWNQIGFFAVVLALRTLIKMMLQFERRVPGFES
jgi:hypothetical protein